MVLGIARGVLDRYPRLKVLFLEAGCEWIPWLVQRMDHYYESERFRGYVPERKASEYLRDCQVYFTTEAEEANLPLVLKFGALPPEVPGSTACWACPPTTISVSSAKP